MQQGDTFEVKNRGQDSNVATRTREHDSQVNTIKSVLASAEVLETIEAIPFYQDFIHWLGAMKAVTILHMPAGS